MAIQIFNAGANLKIVLNGKTRFVAKQSVKSVRIVGRNIKLHSQGCCAPWDYLPFDQITTPLTPSIQALLEVIGNMLEVAGPSTPGAAGMATEVKQNEAIGKLEEIKQSIDTGFTGKATETKQTDQITHLSNITTAVNNLLAAINSLIEQQLFLQPPSRMHDTGEGIIYEGFANPAANENFPVWAIRRRTVTAFGVSYGWAGGNKDRSKIWNQRTSLLYT